MIKTITLARAVEFIKEGTGNKYTKVRFIKKDLSKREMVFQRKNLQQLAGGEAAYSFEDKGLICVYDIAKKSYRTIPQNLGSLNPLMPGLLSVKINGEWYFVVRE